MYSDISILKGLHPGIVLEQELRRKKLSKGPFALSIGEYPQTLGAITKCKRDMNTALSIKIEKALGIDEGYFMILQVYYDIKKIKQKALINRRPNLSIIRSALFWDTSIDKIDWEKQKVAVIKRVFERGNEQEKNEIIRFYGEEIINKLIKKPTPDNLPTQL